MNEHVASKCKIPKKIKLVLFKKNVIDVIKKHTDINKPIRFKNFILKLSDRLASLKDMPEIIIKLAPIHWAINKGTPCVMSFKSINLKYPKSQKKW